MKKYVEKDNYCQPHDRTDKSEMKSLNDLINDLVHDTDTICKSCNSSDIKIDTDKTNPDNNLYTNDDKLLDILNEFDSKLVEFLNESYNLNDISSEHECNEFIDNKTPEILNIISFDTNRTIEYILNNSDVIIKLKESDPLFKLYYNIRKEIISLKIKLKEYKLPNLNFYISNLNLIENAINNYLLLQLIKVFFVGITYSNCCNNKLDGNDCHKNHPNFVEV